MNARTRIPRRPVSQPPGAEGVSGIRLGSPLRRLATGIFVAIAIALVLPAVPALGQAVDLRNPAQALTQYRIDGWQTEQGLPLNTVQTLLQTRDGYLWIGTGGGLTRFDGVRFTTFETSEVPELASRPIFGLMEDAQRNLWIGHYDGAVVYSGGRFRTIYGAEVTSGRRVWSFAQAPDGAVWAATENGLVRWKDGLTRVYQEADGLPTDRLRSLAFDGEGTLWVATTGGGLVSFDGTSFTILDQSNGFPHNAVRAVLPDPEGGVWASTAGGGLAHVREGRIRTFTVSEGLPTNQLTALALDRDGSLWIGTWGAGLSRMREERFTSISTEGGLAGGQIWSVLADREGSIWVGTWVGGLNRLRDRDFVVLGSPEGLSHDNVRSVIHSRDGAAWVATAGGGVNRIHEGQITTIGMNDGLPSEEISIVYEDREGSIWIGTYTGGVARLKAGKIETWGYAGGLPSVDIRVLFQDRRGTVWAGTRSGLARFTGQRFSPVIDQGAPPDGVSAILEDRSGTLWFGTTGQGLIRYRDGVFETLTRDDGLVSNWIMALHEDADGSLWIGTNGEGLNRLRNGRMAAIRPADGLWDGIVQEILEDSTGHLWITCNRGFFRVSRSELDAFAEGRIQRVTSEGYGPGNALRSTTFAGGHQPVGSIDPAGHLWLPSFSGLVIVDPKQLPGAEGPPPVRLERVAIDGVPVPVESGITLPPGSAPLSIRYTAATLQNAERVRFRYRMEGTASDWVDAGTNREAFFPALPHGNYSFRVGASLDGRTWREAPSPLAITVEPHFFQTPWFIALVVLGLVAGTSAVLGLRTRSLRRQKVEMERLVAEKTEELRLANEHLARLSFVDSLTGLANRRRLDEVLDQEWRRASRSGTSLALVVADVDRFKEYNDALGHLEGDNCLMTVADVFRGMGRRAGDIVARYGGEEFVILLPAADCDAAEKFAEELRQAVETRAIPHPTSTVSPVVTISLGVAACIPADGIVSDSLMREADAALYQAKREGRNRVCCHEHPSVAQSLSR
jgi:diguanylate cyclase (GGDEF)-like protein